MQNTFERIVKISVFFLSLSFAEAKSVVSIPSADGTCLHGEFYAATNPKAILIVVHGLQSHAGWYTSGDANADLGISSLAYDRRGSGLSEGKRGDSPGVKSFMEDFAAALRFVEKQNPDHLPVHVIANSLGAVISIQYFSRFRNEVASLILSTPGTHSTRQGDYPLFTKLQILTAPAEKYFESPLENIDFVEPGPYLDWINNDKLGNRYFTAAFLRTVNTLKSDVNAAAKKLRIPLLALLANQDAIIDNRKFKKEIFDTYRGPKELKYYNSKHYLFFGEDRAQVRSDIQSWVLSH